MPITREQAEEFWTCADSDENGQMTFKELVDAMKKNVNANLSDSDIAKIFSDIDRSGDSIISKEEFIDEMVNKNSRAEALCKMFKDFDTSGDGQLSKDEVKKVIAAFFKERDPEETLELFLKHADTSNDGVITYEEFKNFFG